MVTYYGYTKFITSLLITNRWVIQQVLLFTKTSLLLYRSWRQLVSYKRRITSISSSDDTWKIYLMDKFPEHRCPVSIPFNLSSVKLKYWKLIDILQTLAQSCTVSSLKIRYSYGVFQIREMCMLLKWNLFC